MAAKISQVAEEVIYSPNTKARTSTLAVEAILNPASEAHVTNLIVEVIMPYDVPVPPGITAIIEFQNP